MKSLMNLFQRENEIFLAELRSFILIEYNQEESNKISNLETKIKETVRYLI
jgi:hypothetical protein